MPVYDYVCSSCGHRFEVFRGLNESGPHQCPLCEGPVTRAFVPPTIHFKGSGWAKKDRRSTGAPKKSGATQVTSGDSSSGGSAGTGTAESSSGGSSSEGSAKSDATTSAATPALPGNGE